MKMLKLFIVLVSICLAFSQRKGQEIVAAGKFFDIGSNVVTWLDEFGYDAYRSECRFAPYENSSWIKCAAERGKNPNRFSLRPTPSVEIREKVRGGGWNLDLLRPVVDKVVLHYDVAGYSKQCFRVLHDMRTLSCHYLLDVDGTIYQTLDLKENAWHATIANPGGIGIEIANIGAYGVNAPNPFAKWYTRDGTGTKLILPQNAWIRTPNFVGRPRKDQPVTGIIQNTRLTQYDLTNQQYNALIKLLAGLSKVFPRVKPHYPKKNGVLNRNVLTPEEFKNFHGYVGHFHVQANKIDPGPAFDWDHVVKGVEEELAKDKK